MSAVELVDWVVGAVALVIITTGTVCISHAITTGVAEMRWRRSWRNGLRRTIEASIKDGWNTALPPEHRWLMVRQADGLPMVMVRHGRWLNSASRGLKVPVENCCGWIEIEALDNVLTKPGGN